MTEDAPQIRANNRAIDAARYRRLLKNWGQQNLREFPWRDTRDPYRVLMAEYMLLRTQAKQVVPVYQQFLQEYPSPDALAGASQAEVREILAPLGLQWRADYVHEASQIIAIEHEGNVPVAKDALLDLPGVSQYIASAVRCLTLEAPEALIDTNTVRIAGRLFGLTIKPSSRRNRQFRRLIEEMVDPEVPRLYNLSMLDFGALVCTSRQPSCTGCPLLDLCRHGRDMLGGPKEMSK